MLDAGLACASELGQQQVAEAIGFGHALQPAVLAATGNTYLEGDGSGYVLDSLALAVAAVLDPRPFPDVLVDIVRVGNDTDTNAAIAGGLLGARDGLPAIPTRWVQVLQFREEFLTAAHRLTAATIPPEPAGAAAAGARARRSASSTARPRSASPPSARPDTRATPPHPGNGTGRNVRSGRTATTTQEATTASGAATAARGGVTVQRPTGRATWTPSGVVPEGDPLAWPATRRMWTVSVTTVMMSGRGCRSEWGTMDADLAGLFEAHVRYEVQRWRGEAIRSTVAEEVAACFDWLDTVTVCELLPAARAQVWARHVVVDGPVTDELIEEIAWAVRAAYESLLEETGPVAGVLPGARYQQMVSTLIGLRELRREIIDQVTASKVYLQLISHVLYHGLKTYLLTDNAVVRRVPGASSLIRMGQNAVRAATPNLEASIDRRLLAFVASNVADTVRDSRMFLKETLDDAMLRTIADELWSTNGHRPIGEITALVGEESTDDLVATTRDIWLTACVSPVVSRLLDALVDQFYRAHGDKPVSVVLADVGITKEQTTDALATVAEQLTAATLDGGCLEAYVRHRLEGFYTSYTGDAAPAS